VISQLAALGLTMALSVLPMAATGIAGQEPVKPVLSPKSEKALRERVMKWWTARVQRDHQVMYELYEPAYRAATPFSRFLQESAVRVRYDLVAPEIVEIAAESATRVRLKLKLGAMLQRFGGPHEVTPEETWMLEGGRWFKVYEPPALPFPSKAR
jgi:hypothetical protein